MFGNNELMTHAQVEVCGGFLVLAYPSHLGSVQVLMHVTIYGYLGLRVLREVSNTAAFVVTRRLLV